MSGASDRRSLAAVAHRYGSQYRRHRHPRDSRGAGYQADGRGRTMSAIAALAVAGGVGAGLGNDVVLTPLAPEPVLRGARRDNRFARAFQPPHPAATHREAVEGMCTVSITVGATGRVSAVRNAGCANPRFFAVSERQALSRWRFEPATCDGVPVQSSIMQTVRFEMPR